ncbi:MAG: hypothetical protein ACTS6A_01330 [Candidatus Hodgkinia cicadicola]
MGGSYRDSQTNFRDPPAKLLELPSRKPQFVLTSIKAGPRSRLAPFGEVRFSLPLSKRESIPFRAREHYNFVRTLQRSQVSIGAIPTDVNKFGSPFRRC